MPFNKRLIENSIALKTSDFGKGLLCADYDQDSIPKPKAGRFKLVDGYRPVYLQFAFDMSETPLKIELEIRNKPDIAEPPKRQIINITESQLTFGERFYFVCSACGKTFDRLYLRPECEFFHCRECQSLTYESSYLNKSSLGGYKYVMMGIKKLIDKEAELKNVHYAGRLTKKRAALLEKKNKLLGMAPKELPSMFKERISA